MLGLDKDLPSLVRESGRPLSLSTLASSRQSVTHIFGRDHPTRLERFYFIPNNFPRNLFSEYRGASPGLQILGIFILDQRNVFYKFNRNKFNFLFHKPIMRVYFYFLICTSARKIDECASTRISISKDVLAESKGGRINGISIVLEASKNK